MNKFIVAICFYWPLISSCLQIQVVVSRFVSPSMAQIVAYSNLALIVVGLSFIKENISTTSKTSRLWLIYYIIYYCFGLLAMGISGFQTSIIATLVPVIYFIGFYYLLSDKEQFKIFFKVLTFSFVITAFITIILIKLNFHLMSGDIYAWDLDRAEGVYGDANNAALASIIAYLLFDKFFNPIKFIYKILKIIILLIIFYSLFLTYSTTGLFVFTIILFITNYKFFTGIKFILLSVAIVLFYVGIFTLKSQTRDLDISETQKDKVDNIINLLTLNLDKVDNSGRSELVQNVLQYLYENPILGNGIDFASAMRGHNTYVGVWVDAGVFTFLFFLFILVFYLFKTLTLKIHLRFFAMSLLLVLYIFMISLQSVINQPYLIVLFVLVGYIIDYSRMDENHLDFLNKKESE